MDGEAIDPGERFALVVDGNDPDSDPREIARRLVTAVPRFSHLKLGEALVMFLYRAEPKLKQGRRQLGSLCLPRFMGPLGEVANWLLVKAVGGEVPDYLMILDRPWWEGATPVAREALIYHELCHSSHEVDKDGDLKFTDDGRPVFGIQGHDIEEFADVVRAYGAWLPDVQSFIDAARAGGVA